MVIGREGERTLISFALAAIALTAALAFGLTWLSRLMVQRRALAPQPAQEIACAAGIVERFGAETGIGFQSLYDREQETSVSVAAPADDH